VAVSRSGDLALKRRRFKFIQSSNLDFSDWAAIYIILAMSNPIKHHYIPQSILSRFCNSSNQLHSFNKRVGIINKKKFFPAAVCYEENLHTLIYEEERSYEIELFYSQIEGEFLKFLRYIDDCISNGQDLDFIPKTGEIIQLIVSFLTISFWRLPNNKTVAREARKKLRKIYDEAPAGNQEILAFDRKIIRNLERKNEAISTKISQFLVLPVLLSAAQNKDLKKCWFYSTDFDLVISENPIICSINKDYSMGGNIYFPVGSRLCITNAPGEVGRFQQEIFNNAKNIVMANSDECFANLICNS
jgi:hypothetical protein